MDKLGQDVERAAHAIIDVLSVGETARPTRIVDDVEQRNPGMSRDVIRGAMGSLIGESELVSTGKGTIRRVTEGERSTLIDRLRGTP